MEYLKLDDIIPNAKQPRRTFYDASLDELAQSIKERGVLEPVVVRPCGEKYELIMGERRYRASKLAGLTEIPAVIREMSDEDAAADALLENYQREDLNPIDRAKAIESLLAFMTWPKCARTLGVSETTLRRHLELLELPAAVQKALIEAWDKTSGSCFTEAHARILKNINNDPSTQVRFIDKIKMENLSVADTQKLMDAIKEVPEKKEAFLRVPVHVVQEILKQIGRSQTKSRPFKPQTADRHLQALEKAAGQLSDLIDNRLTEYLKIDQMNQLLSTCSTLQSDLEEFCREIRTALRSGDDAFREVYIHCPLCGRIELIGSMKCSVCWSVLRRCLDCGHYDRMYQTCSIFEDHVYMSEAESPKETSRSYKCEHYTPKFEPRKAAA